MLPPHSVNIAMGALNRCGARIGVPELGHHLVPELRKALRPVRWWRRMSSGAQFRSRATLGVEVDRASGYVLWDANRVATAAAAIAACREVAASLGNLDALVRASSAKPYFVNVLREEHLRAYPALMELALSDEVLSAVVPYYQAMPRLCSIGLYYSAVSPDHSPLRGSQNFHLDTRDPRHLKCFVNLVSVEHDDGAFTFLPADRTYELRERLGGPWRAQGSEDPALLGEYERAHAIALTGPAGSAAFVDTARCLHYGSRCRRSSRLVFMFHYATFGDYYALSNDPWRDLRLSNYPAIRARFASTRVRREILSLS